MKANSTERSQDLRGILKEDSLRRWFLLLPFLVAGCAHINTFENGYTYDDISLVEKDPRIQEGGALD